ncbi:hypothetical protein PLICRDRAFT_697039 [Plicaturopsis crispa FD-325 SS-3]|nr:hypothetical protein PLICRDRAFT_697039 [Plicaturopsis crispa FD-325 SS-3]
MPFAIDAGSNIVPVGQWEIVGITILWFDMMLTFSDEVNLIWRHPKTTSSALFFANRYLLALANVPLLSAMMIRWDFQSCVTFQWSRQIIQCVTELIVILILILRTCALYGCRKQILVILGGLTFIFAVVNVVIITSNGLDVFALTPKFVAKSLAQSSVYGLSCRVWDEPNTDVLWPGVFLFDILILAMTLFKTYKVGRERRAVSSSMSLGTLILRDGSIYFATMALLHLGNILSYWFNGFIFVYNPDFEGLSGFANCLSVTLMSRLLLNLQRHKQAGILSTGANASASIIADIVLRDIPIADSQSMALSAHRTTTQPDDDAPSIPPIEPIGPLSVDFDSTRTASQV